MRHIVTTNAYGNYVRNVYVLTELKKYIPLEILDYIDSHVGTTNNCFEQKFAKVVEIWDKKRFPQKTIYLDYVFLLHEERMSFNEMSSFNQEEPTIYREPRPMSRPMARQLERRRLKMLKK